MVNGLYFLDDDDELQEGYLADIHAKLGSAPLNADFAWCSVKLVDYKGEHVIGKGFRYYSDQCPPPAELLGRATTVGSGFGLTIKGEVYVNLRGLNERMALGEDTDFILKLVTSGYAPVVSPGVGVIVHSNNQSKLSCDDCKQKRYDVFEYLVKEYAPRLADNSLLLVYFMRVPISF